MLTKYAIIVAGGSGSRMGTDIPKQFLEIQGKPILIHTLLKFQEIVDKVIIVLPKDQFHHWNELQKRFNLNMRIDLAEGGETRFDSVKNGLGLIYQLDGLVAVHDAVRPFVSEITIEKAFISAEKNGSGVVAVPVKDSIRRKDADQNIALDRNYYYLMQTPQTFRLPLLKKAYQNAKGKNFTDDASVFEADGNEVKLIDGSYDNIKITTPEDLFLAEAILKFQKK